MDDPDDLDADRLDPGFADRFLRDDRRPPCQLYLLSPSAIEAGFADTLARALDGGPVAAFRFRATGTDEHALARLAEPLQKVCAARDVAFLVTGSVSLARRLGADGVHLDQGDDAREARQQLGPAVQIGVTCRDSRHLAMEAGEAGADYVAFGAFHPGNAEELSRRPELAILSWWSTVFELPSVAFGGITPANARPLIEAGADFLAASGAVWNHPDGPDRAVAAFTAVLPA